MLRHGGSQPRKEEGASHLARRGKNAGAFLKTVSFVRSFCYNKETERKRYESRSFGGGDTMNYGELKKTDIANGIGVRVTLFVSGCTHHCPGCFQPETWDFAYGQKYTWETEMEIIEALKPGYVKGLTLGNGSSEGEQGEMCGDGRDALEDRCPGRRRVRAGKKGYHSPFPRVVQSADH